MPPKRAGSGGDEGSVDITTLPPSDLQSIKQRLEGDLDTLVNSQTALNSLVSKFNTSAQAIETLGASQPGGKGGGRPLPEERCACRCAVSA